MSSSKEQSSAKNPSPSGGGREESRRPPGRSCLVSCLVIALTALLWGIIFYCTSGMHQQLPYYRTAREQARFEKTALKSPLLLDGDRLHFVRADWTLAVVRTDTGVVAKEYPELAQRMPDDLLALARSDVGAWRKRGKTAYAACPLGLIVVNRETGEADFSFCGIAKGTGDYLAFQNNLFIKNRESRLVLLACETLAQRPLCDMAAGVFDIMNGRLLVLETSPVSGVQTLRCFDAASGESLWAKESPADQIWKGMACGDEEVYVFASAMAAPPASASTAGALDEVLVFDREGEVREKFIPALDDFAGAWPEFFDLSFTFRENRYWRGRRNGLPVDPLDILDAGRRAPEEARALAGDGIAPAVWLWLDRDSLFGIGLETISDAAGKPNRRAVLFLTGKDGGWQAPAGNPAGVADLAALLPDIQPLYRLTANAEAVFLAAPDGTVECRDRGDGEVRWRLDSAGGRTPQ